MTEAWALRLLTHVIARQDRRSAGRRCQYCGVAVFERRQARVGHRPDGASVDHVLPQNAGGTDVIDNLKLSCGWCNQGRAITGDCIGALACAKAVVGRAPYPRLSAWWRSAVGFSRQRELDTFNRRQERTGAMFIAGDALRCDEEAAP